MDEDAKQSLALHQYRQTGVGQEKGKACTSEKRSAVLRMKLVNANPAPRVVGLDELPGKANYFIGNDPTRWRTNVPTYAKVKYPNVYPGVDLIYYGNQQQLEYDFVVAPGTDPQAIRMSFKGARKLEVDARGDILLNAMGGHVRLRKPIVYQEVDGVKKEIAGDYRLLGQRQIGFQVGAYDPARPLVIDPVVIFSTHFGGGREEASYAIALDSEGNPYLTGVARSDDFPIDNSAYQQEFKRGNSRCEFLDAFVTRLNADGSGIVYSTYLGGSGDDLSFGIAVDKNSKAYVTGLTTSLNFPREKAQQPGFMGSKKAGCLQGDAFVTKLNGTGSDLEYSTYLGGTGYDAGSSIAVDGDGNAYVTGNTSSEDFPLMLPMQVHSGDSDAFITKFNEIGSAHIYSTYLGGKDDDFGMGIAADSDGNAIVVGQTESSDFPIRSGIKKSGPDDAFVTKLNSFGSDTIYSIFLGGSDSESGNGIAVDRDGNAYVTGVTESDNFPTTSPFQSYGGNEDAFITKLSPTGFRIYSSWLGGDRNDVGRGIAVDRENNAYVTGLTTGHFPTVDAVQPAHGGGVDAFLTKIYADGFEKVYSTYLGGGDQDIGRGVAVDAAGNAYVVGATTSDNFPRVKALQPGLRGDEDAFIVKLGDPTDLKLTLTSTPDPVITDKEIAYKITVTNIGLAVAHFVRVTDQLPPDTTLVRISAMGGLCGGRGNERSCIFISIAPNDSVIVTVVARVDCTVTDGALLDNTATVNALTQDTDLGNNSKEIVTFASNPPPTLMNCPASIPFLYTGRPGEQSLDLRIFFPPTATDNCPGTIVTCKPGRYLSGVPVPVTCTATDAGGATASCSFTTIAFDVRLQDDLSSDILLFNSFTGDYRYTRCRDGMIITGRGRANRQGCTFSLEDPGRVSAKFEHCPQLTPNRGRASVRSSPLGPECLIKDSNTAAKTGTCR
jgi:uncharacterized repeat protein (TIGR01451 family)